MKKLKQLSRKIKAVSGVLVLLGIASVVILGPVSDTVAALSTTSYSLASVNNTGNGQGGNGASTISERTTRTISADGQRIVFWSPASNLVANDTNGKVDIFMRDQKTGTTTRASISSTGVESDAHTSKYAVSETARYIAYATTAKTLEGGSNPNSRSYVYLHDMMTGSNTYIPAPSGWNPDYFEPREVSNDGRFIIAETIPPMQDANGVNVSKWRVVIYDMDTATWSRLASPLSGGEQNTDQNQIATSCDGSFLVFRSYNTNLTASDNNGSTSDIFLVDLRKGNKVTNLTHNFNGASSEPRISCNGSYVTFKSSATNIDPNFTSLTGDHYYRYDRINSVFSLVNQNTNGSLLYDAKSYQVADSGRVIFIAKYTNQFGNYLPYFFVRDEENQVTETVIDHITSQQLNYGAGGISSFPAIDQYGRVFAFTSPRTDLIPSDTNGFSDVFMSEFN